MIRTAALVPLAAKLGCARRIDTNREVSVPAPVDGNASRQYAALVMDHEGPFGVRVAVDGPWGAATVDTMVAATYDLRPPLPLLAVYLLPFLAVGFLWTLRLVRRRRARAAPQV